MESVVEMQILALIVCFYFSNQWKEIRDYGTISPADGIFKGTTMDSS